MEWKQYNNYLVSEYGDVKNSKGLMMKPDITYKGYKKITLSGKKWYIHRLVAMLWINNPQNKPQVNHIDMNKVNNHYSNLEWVTNTENTLHAYSINKSKKLTTPEQYSYIIECTKKGMKPKDIVKLTGLNRNTIVAIRQGYNNKRFTFQQDPPTNHPYI